MSNYENNKICMKSLRFRGAKKNQVCSKIHLQDHKANENHGFAVRDDFQEPQKTLLRSGPATYVSKR